MRESTSEQLARGFRWAAIAAVIGIVAGLGAVALSLLANGAEGLHRQFPWTLWLLPLCGALGALLYAKLEIPFDMGTVAVIDHQRKGTRISAKLAPAILLGTALTLLGGGSVGKEAAALQLGGAAGSGLAVVADEGESSQRTFILCGMAAGFSALMFTPIAATIFVLEVSRMKARELLSVRTLCVPLSSAVAFAVASFFGVGRLWTNDIAVPNLPDQLMETAVLTLLCAFAGIAFVLLLKLLRTACVTFLKSPYLRIAIGSALVIALTLFAGTDAYSGTGAQQITTALAGGTLPLDAVEWKLALTVICLSFGFKGGEIMPIFSIGACLGSTFALLTGGPVAFMAALGLVVLFSTCTRSPVAATIIGIEAFGWAGAPYFLIGAFLSSLLSRHFSLYDTDNWMLDVAWAQRTDLFGDLIDEEAARQANRDRRA